MKKYIGIDVGTTSITLILIQNERILEKISFVNDFIVTEYSYEKIQDPVVIYEKIVKNLDSLINRYSDIEAIGLTGQMHGFLYVDEEIQALSPLFTWQDRRCLEKMDSGISYVDYINKSVGHSLKAGYGLSTHFFNLKNELCPSRNYQLMTIHSYIASKLAGNKELVMHISDADSFGLFDLKKMTFDQTALKKIDINKDNLPAVTIDKKHLGSYRNIQVFVAIGDNQASYLGATQHHELLINIGTGSQVSLYTRKIKKMPSGIEVRPYIAKNEYLLVGASQNGGKAYELLAKFFQSYDKQDLETIYRKMAAIDRKILDDTLSSGLEFSPLFFGTRRNPQVKASISGLNFQNFSFDYIVSALIKGMAKELYELAQKLGINKETKLVGSGNGFRKNELLQIALKHYFQKEIKINYFYEEAAYGAAKFVRDKEFINGI